MKLLALITAFGLYHYVEKPKLLQSYFWLSELQKFISERLTEKLLQLLLVLVITVSALWFVVEVLFDFRTNSVGYLIVNVLVIYYCLGPRTIAEDLKHEKKSEYLNIPPKAKPEQAVYAITDAALHRWFGVFFWYVVLGVYGALAYRVICHLTQSTESSDEETKRILTLIEYPVVILMTVSLALASDFDRIWRHCKQYLTRETLLSLDSQFLYKSMDFAVEQCEIETKDENKAQIIEKTTFAVLKRMLVVWLVFVALLLLFSGG